MLSKYSICLPLLAAVLSLTPTHTAAHGADECSMAYPADNGLICRECPPGTYVAADCEVNWGIPDCRHCPEAEYQPSCTRARTCATCYACTTHGAVEQTPCTATHDSACVCPDGKYYDRQSSEEGLCLPHRSCPVGQGVCEIGTPLSNTICGVCEPGTYSDSDSTDHCKVCRTCLEYSSDCSDSIDAICSEVTEIKDQSAKRNLDLMIGLPVGLLVPAVVILIAVLVYLRRIGYLSCTEDEDNHEDEANNNDKSDITSVKLVNGYPAVSSTSASHTDLESENSHSYDLDENDTSNLSYDTDLSTDACPIQPRKPGQIVMDRTHRNTPHGRRTYNDIPSYIAQHFSYPDVVKLLRNCQGVVGGEQQMNIWISDAKHDFRVEGREEQRYQLLTRYCQIRHKHCYKDLCIAMKQCKFNVLLEQFKAWYNHGVRNVTPSETNEAGHGYRDTGVQMQELKI